MHAEFLHARLVAEDAALGLLGAGVDGQYGKSSAGTLQHMDAKFVDAGTLASTGHTADADADALAAIGQALLNDFLSDALVVGIGALYEGYGLSEDGRIALEDAFHVVGGGQLATGKTASLQVGIDDGGLLHAAVYDQSLVFFAVFWMFHKLKD